MLLQGPQGRLGDVTSLGPEPQELRLDLCKLRLLPQGTEGWRGCGLCVVGNLKVSLTERAISKGRHRDHPTLLSFLTNMLAFLAPRDTPRRVLRTVLSTQDHLCCHPNWVFRKLPPRPKEGENALPTPAPGFVLWSRGDAHIMAPPGWGPRQPCQLMAEYREATPSGTQTLAVYPTPTPLGLITLGLLARREPLFVHHGAACGVRPDLGDSKFIGCLTKHVPKPPGCRGHADL